MPLPKHILIIRLSAMGDVAMTVPVIRAFTQQYPEVKITVLTRTFFEPFFRDINNVSVYKADVKGEHKGLFGLWRLARALKKLEIDAVADFHNVLRSNILKRFLKAPFYQIDKGREEKKALVSGKLFKPLKSTHMRYAYVLERIGYKIDLSSPSFPKPIVLDEVLQAYIPKHRPSIGIAPFATYESKVYPLELMQKVIEELSQLYTIVLFGGGEVELERLDAIDKTYENVVSVAGKLTLEEELNLMSNLDLMLSMDSGNAHIAAMLGIKTLTIWGVTHPYAGFAPFNQPEDYCLLSDKAKYPLIPTSIYGNKYPEGYQNAAESIPVDTVIEKVRSIVDYTSS